MRTVFITIILLICVGQVRSQSDYSFVFKDLDNNLLQLWLNEDADQTVRTDLLNGVMRSWESAEKEIARVSILHFDQQGFISDQQKRLNFIQEAILKNERKSVVKAQKELYILLSEFSEVRLCFTNDVYSLDRLIAGYDAYLEVHGIIHDQMMGIYEWTEFIWYVDQLKCRVEEIELSMNLTDPSPSFTKVASALAKLQTCLKTLDESLGDAYRPDFEVPCNELQIAFEELFSAYGNSLSL